MKTQNPKKMNRMNRKKTEEQDKIEEHLKQEEQNKENEKANKYKNQEQNEQASNKILSLTLPPCKKMKWNKVITKKNRNQKVKIWKNKRTKIMVEISCSLKRLKRKKKIEKFLHENEFLKKLWTYKTLVALYIFIRWYNLFKNSNLFWKNKHCHLVDIQYW